MSPPIIKRLNTIGIKFIDCEREVSVCDHVLVNILGLSADSGDVRAIGESGRHIILVKLSSKLKYDEICQMHEGKEYTISDTTTVSIIDSSTYSTKVTIKNVPFELSIHALNKILERFGTVDHIDVGMWKSSVFGNLMSMERFAWMPYMHTPIPSSLYIPQTKTYIYFYHEKQDRTCNRCGSLEHRAPGCDVSRSTKPQDRSNVINVNIEDFLLLVETESRSNAQDVGDTSTPNKSPVPTDQAGEAQVHELDVGGALASNVTSSPADQDIKNKENDKVSAVTDLGDRSNLNESIDDVSHDVNKPNTSISHENHTRETRQTSKRKFTQSPQSPEYSTILKTPVANDTQRSPPAKTQKSLKTLGIRISGKASLV